MAVWNVKPGGNYGAEQAERVKVFAKIEPSGNWKSGISAWIEKAEFAECFEAAVWFTGAGIKVVEAKGEKVKVAGPGYYATVGA